MSLCWFSFGLVYFGIALHTPEFGSSVFLVFFIGGLMDLPVVFFAPVLLNRLGRKLCMTGHHCVNAFDSQFLLIYFYYFLLIYSLYRFTPEL